MKLYLQVGLEGETPAKLRELIEHCETEIIRQRGYSDGRAAGTWMFDGNTQEEHFKRIQKGIEDGDPRYMDLIPEPRVGGEFAGEMTWEQIIDEEFDRPPMDDGDATHYQTYCEAFQSGAQDEILSYGRESVQA